MVGALFAAPFAAAHAMFAPAAVDHAVVEAAIADPGRPGPDRSMDGGRRPAEVLGFIDPRPGEHVLDVLASPGYYTELVARIVGPNGAVVAYDPPQFVSAPAAKKMWASRIRRLGNVTQSLQPLHRVRLPRASFDLVLMHLAYHETYWRSEKYGLRRMDPRSFLAKVREAVKPGGRVVVVDHVALSNDDARATVDRLHRIDPSVVRADFERAGFAFAGESQALRNPRDDLRRSIFDPAVRGRTDRFVLMFRRP